MAKNRIEWKTKANDPDMILLAAQTLAKTANLVKEFDFKKSGYNALRVQLGVDFAAAAAGNIVMTVYPSCDDGVTFDFTPSHTLTMTGVSGVSRTNSVDISGIPYFKLKVENQDAANDHDIVVNAAGRYWEA